jgi:hypothetical protein
MSNNDETFELDAELTRIHSQLDEARNSSTDSDVRLASRECLDALDALIAAMKTPEATRVIDYDSFLRNAGRTYLLTAGSFLGRDAPNGGEKLKEALIGARVDLSARREVLEHVMMVVREKRGPTHAA